MRLQNAVREELLDGWLQGRGLEAELDRAVERVLRGEVSPHRAVRDLIERMTPHGER
jgi:hypothetical protein